MPNKRERKIRRRLTLGKMEECERRLNVLAAAVDALVVKEEILLQKLEALGFSDAVLAVRKLGAATPGDAVCRCGHSANDHRGEVGRCLMLGADFGGGVGERCSCARFVPLAEHA